MTPINTHRRSAPAQVAKRSQYVDDMTLAIERLADRERMPSPCAIWVGNLRRIGAHRLSAHGLSSLVDNAELLISELVTNALQHGAGERIVFHLVITEDMVVIEVDDGSPCRPVVRSAGDFEESGRGMLLVSALADSWGVSTDGTRTWCTLATPASARRSRPRACLRQTPEPP